MKKNLTIFERAVKNKEKFKLQLISLALATTAIISTGCTSSKTPIQDDTKPGIEEVVNDYSKEELKSEQVDPLTAANFETEVDKLIESLKQKGMDISRKEAGTLLLYNNMCEITIDDHMTIVNGSFNILGNDCYDINCSIDYGNNITKHNVANSHENYVGLAQFSYDDKGKAVLSFFDALNVKIKKAISDNNSNLKSEINNICDFAYRFCNNESYLLVDGEEVYLTDNLETVQLLVGKSVSDLTNTILVYEASNKWVDLLVEASSNEYIDAAINSVWAYDPLNPQISK